MFQLPEPERKRDALEMHFFRLASRNKDRLLFTSTITKAKLRPKLCIIQNFSTFLACHYKSSSGENAMPKKYSRCSLHLTPKYHFSRFPTKGFPFSRPK